MMDFKNAEELLKLCDENNRSISQVMRQRECDHGDEDMDQIQSRMEQVLAIMKESAFTPLKTPVKSMGGLIGGEAKKLETCYQEGKDICGDTLSTGIAYAMAVLEVNASMGIIVAAPTAGSWPAPASRSAATPSHTSRRLAWPAPSAARTWC